MSELSEMAIVVWEARAPQPITREQAEVAGAAVAATVAALDLLLGLPVVVSAMAKAIVGADDEAYVDGREGASADNAAAAALRIIRTALTPAPEPAAPVAQASGEQAGE
jgi:hypothetical protein